MERLFYIHPNEKGLYKRIIWHIFAALSTGISFFLCLSKIFSVEYVLSEWNRGGLSGGFALYINKITDTLLVSDGMVLKKLAGASESCGLFMTVCMLLISVPAFLIIRSGKKRMVMIFPVIMAAAMIFTSSQADATWLIIFTSVIILDLAVIDMEGKNLIAGLMVIVIAAAVMGLLVNATENRAFMDKPAWISSIETKIKDTVSDMYYGESPLGEGNISGDIREADDDIIALKVQTDDPQPAYLRGFIGEIYKTDKWENLSYQTYEENRELMYWLKENGFDGTGQSGLAESLTDRNLKKQQVSIKTVNADSKYAYIPYGFYDESDEQINWYQSYITAGRFGRLKNYTYTAYTKDPAFDWPDTAGKLFTAYYKDKTDHDIKNYFENESWFNTFVYEHYTYMPPEQIRLISRYYDKGAAQTGENGQHIEYGTAIKGIQEFLKNEFVYTKDPGYDSDAGAMESFFKEKKGYDVHYATAATLLFRYCGIPARYVEGYLITPEDVDNTGDDNTIEIMQSNVHAWTEIYVDGIGFVPVETCPEYYDIMPQADISVGFENSPSDKEFKHQEEGSTKENPVYYETENKTGKLIIKDIFYLILILLSACLLIIFLKKIYKKIRKSVRRNILFRKAEPKAAVAAIYGYMENRGFTLDTNIRKLGNRAAYSREDITEDERKYMLNRLKEAGKETKTFAKIFFRRKKKSR